MTETEKASGAAEALSAAEEAHGEGARELTRAGLEDGLAALLRGETESTPTAEGEGAQPNAEAADKGGLQQKGQGEGAGEGEGEVEAEAEAGAEGEAEAEADAEDHERGQWPESAHKRVDKLTAQKAELREKAEGLTTEVETLTGRITELEEKLKEAETNGGAQGPSAGDPLGFIKSPEELSKFVTNIKAQARVIEDYFDDALDERGMEAFKGWAKNQGAFDAETGEFNTAKLKQLKRVAQDALTELAPARLDFLRREREANAAAEEQFPWLKDRNSAEYKVWVETVNGFPDVKRMPHWKGVAALFVEGMAAHKAKQAARAKGNNGANGMGNGKAAGAKAPAAKLPGAARALPQRETATGSQADRIASLREKANRERSPLAFEELLKAQLSGVGE